MTPAQLVAATGCLTEDANRIARPLGQFAPQYGITTPVRMAAFLGQMAHESARFQRLEENLNYTSAARIAEMFGPTLLAQGDFPRREAETDQQYRVRLRARREDLATAYVRRPEALANRVYAWKNGNDSESSGDGWRFRGRGLPGLTGHDNYAAFGSAIGEPIVATPEIVAQPAYAVLAGCWYWQRAGCNALADAGKLDLITRRINGPAMAGHADRMRITHRAFAALTGD